MHLKVSAITIDGALLIFPQLLLLPQLLAAVEGLPKVRFYAMQHCSASPLTRISFSTTGTSTEADIREIKEGLRHLERIVLLMCEHQNIDISSADVGGPAPNTPSTGMPSPLGNFRGLSISRGGGSRGSSAQSGGRAGELLLA